MQCWRRCGNCVTRQVAQNGADGHQSDHIPAQAFDLEHVKYLSEFNYHSGTCHWSAAIGVDHAESDGAQLRPGQSLRELPPDRLPCRRARLAG
ncbi:hypothetical protein F7089_15670, partial [Dickeya dianthicola]|nr:hypothetical protein [Dickeya dianthicola]MBI0524002.1 hypothetical protein [Dickeya dianthicola]